MRQKVILLTVTVAVIIVWFTATLLSDNRPQLGLDLQGGLSVVLVPVKGSDLSTLDAAVADHPQPRRRSGHRRTRREPAGQPDRRRPARCEGPQPQRSRSSSAQTAELRFRPVVTTLPWSAAPETATTTPAAAEPGSTTTTKPTKLKAGTTTTKGRHWRAARSTPNRSRWCDRPRMARRRSRRRRRPSAGATPGTTAAGGSTTTTAPPINSCRDGGLVTPRRQGHG